MALSIWSEVSISPYALENIFINFSLFNLHQTPRLNPDRPYLETRIHLPGHHLKIVT